MQRVKKRAKLSIETIAKEFRRPNSISPYFLDTSITDKLLNTILHYSCKYGNKYLVEEIIKKDNTNINVQNKYGEAPIHLAAEYLNTEIVAVLVKNGADPLIKAKLGKTPLYYALGYKEDIEFYGNTPIGDDDPERLAKRLEIFCLLTSGDAKEATNINDFSGACPLSYMAYNGDTNMLEKFLCNLKGGINTESYIGITPLGYACKAKRDDTVKMLLRKDASIYGRDIYDRTILMLSCIGGLTDLVKDPKFIRAFSLEYKDKFGYTALHYAAENGHTEIVEFLLSKNDKIMNIQNEFGRTPLFLAIIHKHGKIARYLTQKGAIQGVVDKFGNTSSQELHKREFSSDSA